MRKFKSTTIGSQNVTDKAFLGSLDDDYCSKAWKEFTSLTPEELRNLKEIMSLNISSNTLINYYYQNNDYEAALELKKSKPRIYKRKVRCINTGIVYESLSEAAKDNNLSRMRLYWLLNKAKRQSVLQFEYI